jgi:hypothetical protein
MKNNHDPLTKAVKAIQQTPVSTGPPQQIIDATLTKLSEAAGSTPPVTDNRRLPILDRFKATKSIIRLAAAAVLLISAGYITGRLSAPAPPDPNQLYSALEPAIRQQLLGEMKQYWQLSTAATYARLKEDLDQQYCQDLNRFATQTFAASTAVTNQLLEELIKSINSAQTQDRRWVTTALQQIESNRLQDKNQLSHGLATLAVYTDDQLLKTKNDIAQFVSNTITPNLSQTPQMERSKK